MIKFLLFSLSEGITNLWRSRILNLLSIGTMLLAITILGAFLLVGVNLKNALGNWERQIQFHAFLAEGLSDQEVETLKTEIQKLEGVIEVQYISKLDALKKFNADFAQYQDISQALPESPFPASFEVILQQGANEADFKKLQLAMSKWQGIEEVHYDFEIFERLSLFSKFIQWTSLFLSAIVIFASVFTVSNVLKLTFFTRRDEVDIMKLVGASRAYIRGPFMVEGLLQGFLGSVLGLLLLFLSLNFLKGYISAEPDSMWAQVRLSFLPLAWQAAICFGGCMVGLFGAAISLNQFLKEHISYQ